MVCAVRFTHCILLALVIVLVVQLVVASTLLLYPAHNQQAMIDQPASPVRHASSFLLEFVLILTPASSGERPIGNSGSFSVILLCIMRRIASAVFSLLLASLRYYHVPVHGCDTLNVGVTAAAFAQLKADVCLL
jgi:hypothetical protein